MGSAWQAVARPGCGAVVPGRGMPWGATGSAEHWTWDNRGIGSTRGHLCTEQPCSLPSTSLSNTSTDKD